MSQQNQNLGQSQQSYGYNSGQSHSPLHDNYTINKGSTIASRLRYFNQERGSIEELQIQNLVDQNTISEDDGQLYLLSVQNALLLNRIETMQRELSTITNVKTDMQIELQAHHRQGTDNSPAKQTKSAERKSSISQFTVEPVKPLSRISVSYSPTQQLQPIEQSRNFDIGQPSPQKRMQTSYNPCVPQSVRDIPGYSMPQGQEDPYNEFTLRRRPSIIKITYPTPLKEEPKPSAQKLEPVLAISIDAPPQTEEPKPLNIRPPLPSLQPLLKAQPRQREQQEGLAQLPSQRQTDIKNPLKLSLRDSAQRQISQPPPNQAKNTTLLPTPSLVTSKTEQEIFGIEKEQVSPRFVIASIHKDRSVSEKSPTAPTIDLVAQLHNRKMQSLDQFIDRTKTNLDQILRHSRQSSVATPDKSRSTIPKEDLVTRQFQASPPMEKQALDSFRPQGNPSESIESQQIKRDQQTSSTPPTEKTQQDDLEVQAIFPNGRVGNLDKQQPEHLRQPESEHPISHITPRSKRLGYRQTTGANYLPSQHDTFQNSSSKSRFPPNLDMNVQQGADYRPNLSQPYARVDQSDRYQQGTNQSPPRSLNSQKLNDIVISPSKAQNVNQPSTKVLTTFQLDQTSFLPNQATEIDHQHNKEGIVQLPDGNKFATQKTTHLWRQSSRRLSNPLFQASSSGIQEKPMINNQISYSTNQPHIRSPRMLQSRRFSGVQVSPTKQSSQGQNLDKILHTQKIADITIAPKPQQTYKSTSTQSPLKSLQYERLEDLSMYPSEQVSSQHQSNQPYSIRNLQQQRLNNISISPSKLLEVSHHQQDHIQQTEKGHDETKVYTDQKLSSMNVHASLNDRHLTQRRLSGVGIAPSQKATKQANESSKLHRKLTQQQLNDIIISPTKSEKQNEQSSLNTEQYKQSEPTLPSTSTHHIRGLQQRRFSGIGISPNTRLVEDIGIQTTSIDSVQNIKPKLGVRQMSGTHYTPEKSSIQQISTNNSPNSLQQTTSTEQQYRPSAPATKHLIQRRMSGVGYQPKQPQANSKSPEDAFNQTTPKHFHSRPYNLAFSRTIDLNLRLESQDVDPQSIYKSSTSQSTQTAKQNLFVRQLSGLSLEGSQPTPNKDLTTQQEQRINQLLDYISTLENQMAKDKQQLDLIKIPRNPNLSINQFDLKGYKSEGLNFSPQSQSEKFSQLQEPKYEPTSKKRNLSSMLVLAEEIFPTSRKLINQNILPLQISQISQYVQTAQLKTHDEVILRQKPLQFYRMLSEGFIFKSQSQLKITPSNQTPQKNESGQSNQPKQQSEFIMNTEFVESTSFEQHPQSLKSSQGEENQNVIEKPKFIESSQQTDPREDREAETQTLWTSLERKDSRSYTLIAQPISVEIQTDIPLEQQPKEVYVPSFSEIPETNAQIVLLQQVFKFANKQSLEKLLIENEQLRSNVQQSSKNNQNIKESNINQLNPDEGPHQQQINKTQHSLNQGSSIQSIQEGFQNINVQTDWQDPSTKKQVEFHHMKTTIETFQEQIDSLQIQNRQLASEIQIKDTMLSNKKLDSVDKPTRSQSVNEAVRRDIPQIKPYKSRTSQPSRKNSQRSDARMEELNYIQTINELQQQIRQLKAQLSDQQQPLDVTFLQNEKIREAIGTELSEKVYFNSLFRLALEENLQDMILLFEKDLNESFDFVVSTISRVHDKAKALVERHNEILPVRGFAREMYNILNDLSSNINDRRKSIVKNIDLQLSEDKLHYQRIIQQVKDEMVALQISLNSGQSDQLAQLKELAEKQQKQILDFKDEVLYLQGERIALKQRLVLIEKDENVNRAAEINGIFSKEPKQTRQLSRKKP